MPSWRAFAKINLSLEVLGHRSDGYHDIVSILQTVDLFDTLTFEPADTLSLTCSMPALAHEDNLVLRAARLLQKTTGQAAGAAIHLEKGIPTASGLGGGSSDAATTLVALSQLWGLYMTEANLLNLAECLGSDVPFFLEGGTVLVEGRGETLTPLAPLTEHWVVLVRAPLEVERKTALMYDNLTRQEYTSGSVTRMMARSICDGRPLDPGLIFNAFEWIAYRLFWQVDETRQRVVDAGADHVRLCGAGPSLFALYDSEEPARALYERLEEEQMEVYLTKTVQVRPKAPLEETAAGEPSDKVTG